MSSLEFTREQKILLNLTAMCISGEPSFNDVQKSQISQLEDSDWAAIFVDAKLHAVSLMIFDTLSVNRELIPQNIYKGWRRYAINAVVNNARVYCSQNDLVKQLDEQAIPYVILKGAAAGAYYPKPDMRMYGDVDFLVEPERKEQTEKLLISNGYTKELDEHPNHYVFRKTNAHLEMHFEIAGIPYGKIGDKVKEFLSGMFNKKEQKEYDGHLFNVPSNVYHAIILLLHMQHHMLGEGIGLRHLSDWAVFVKSTHTEPFWRQTLLPFLNEIGLNVYVNVMTSACVKYLSIPNPEWLVACDEELCAEVMSDILVGGNFGRKNKNRADSGMLISEHGKSGTKHCALYNLSHSLHKAVLRKKAVKKCIILYPFVYVYKAVRFLFLSAIGKRPSIIKMIPEAEKRRNVYEKLRIFEIDSKEKR